MSRWQAVDHSAQQSWQLTLRGYRHVSLGGALRGHLALGVNLETLDGGGTAVGADIGVGVSYNVTSWLTAWVDATLGRRQWVSRPPDGAGASETKFLLSAGLSWR